MSGFLYALGEWVVGHRGRVIAGWLLALALLGGLAGVTTKGFAEDFSLPGTESQQALDSLKITLPQLANTSAQIIVVSPDGTAISGETGRRIVADLVAATGDLAFADTVVDPFADGSQSQLSDDGRAAIVQMQANVSASDFTDADRAALVALAEHTAAAHPGWTVSAGGEAFNANVPHVSIVEALGVVIALLVLLLTLGSLWAAGLPIVTAIVGVGASMALVVASTALTTVSSTTPMLGLMLGLAVGIDYALFIVSRHREQLGQGMSAAESVARSVATAGSAVVFAGLTVIIALVGLALARIPFLTLMGVAAAITVAISVGVALTLLPALLSLLGPRLAPRRRRSGRHPQSATVRPAKDEPTDVGPAHDEHEHEPEVPRRTRPTFAERWVRLVTKVPALTVIIVVVGLGALALPARHLELALPTAGDATIGTPARTTYDLITDHFGAGYNGPLLITTRIVTSTDPLGLMDDLKHELEQVPGVQSVPLATPNAKLDTGIMQVIPTTGPTDPATAELVQRIRALQPRLHATYGVDIKVTGFTAVAIDISDRLAGALLPFGIFVVGLSLILLTMVFRSIAVPLKATIGYLLSVGAAFGATTLVFVQGHGASLINLDKPGPVISFLPILLMGILFGLAMDYEVFLVSRIREAYVHATATGREHAQAAIRSGFSSAARVVVAAAVIMISVFAFFVPQGEGPIKPIAFGLAVGVFVDAFCVRMTLVPAVLALLGNRAWWLPRWLARRLPDLDVEGDALNRQLALRAWPYPDSDDIIVAVDDAGRTMIDVRAGTVLAITGPERARRALLFSLTGRLSTRRGRPDGVSLPTQAKVLGRSPIEQPGAVRRRSAWLSSEDLARSRPGSAPLIVIDEPTRLSPAGRDQLTALLADPTRTVLLGVSDPGRLASLPLPAGRTVHLPLPDPASSAPAQPTPAVKELLHA